MPLLRHALKRATKRLQKKSKRLVKRVAVWERPGVVPKKKFFFDVIVNPFKSFVFDFLSFCDLGAHKSLRMKRSNDEPLLLKKSSRFPTVARLPSNIVPLDCWRKICEWLSPADALVTMVTCRQLHATISGNIRYWQVRLRRNVLESLWPPEWKILASGPRLWKLTRFHNVRRTNESRRRFFERLITKRSPEYVYLNNGLLEFLKIVTGDASWMLQESHISKYEKRITLLFQQPSTRKFARYQITVFLNVSMSKPLANRSVEPPFGFDPPLSSYRVGSPDLKGGSSIELTAHFVGTLLVVAAARSTKN